MSQTTSEFEARKSDGSLSESSGKIQLAIGCPILPSRILPVACFRVIVWIKLSFSLCELDLLTYLMALSRNVHVVSWSFPISSARKFLSR